MSINPELVVMRLADMRRVHPKQDNTRRCPRCQHQVGIYPSGQAVLAAHPETPIICHVCYAGGPPADLLVLAPGADREPAESIDAAP